MTFKLLPAADKGRKQLKRFFTRFPTGIWQVSLVNLLMAAGFSISIPFLSLYLNLDRNVPMALVGVILLIAGLSQAGSQLLAGELCDTVGRRPLIIFSVITRAVAYSIMAVLIAVSAPVFIIAIVYILSQALGATGRPATQAMVTDLSPARKLTEAFGILRIGINLGWAAGPAIGGYLAGLLPYSWLFGVAAIITVLPAFLAFGLKESIEKKSYTTDFKGLARVRHNRSFMLFILFNLALFLAMGQMMSTLSIFAVERAGFTTAMYGLLLTINGIIVIVFQYPVAHSIDKFSKSRVLVLGSLLYAVGYLAYVFVGSYAVAAIGMVIISLGEITFAPASMSIVGQIAPRGQRGRYMGFFGLNQILGISTAPLLGGILLDVFVTGSLGIWGVISFIALLAAVSFAWWSKKYNPA